MPNAAINLIQKLTLIHAHWSPHVVAEMNDIPFKLVKLEGHFVRQELFGHSHDASRSMAAL